MKRVWRQQYTENRKEWRNRQDKRYDDVGLLSLPVAIGWLACRRRSYAMAWRIVNEVTWEKITAGQLRRRGMSNP